MFPRSKSFENPSSVGRRPACFPKSMDSKRSSTKGNHDALLTVWFVMKDFNLIPLKLAKDAPVLMTN